MLESRQIVVDRALVIEIPSNVEVIVRKRKARRNILQLIKKILKLDIMTSDYKESALSQINHRIKFN